jgi:putative transposase
MSHGHERSHRRSIRLRGYDYTRTGAYFVTICTHGRVCLFGDIADGKTRSNNAGLMIKKWWGELNRKFPTVETDEYIVMPNHFHGIINNVSVGADLCVCPPSDTNTKGAFTKGAHTGAPLPEIVQWFKTMMTNEYILIESSRGYLLF